MSAIIQYQRYPLGDLFTYKYHKTQFWLCNLNL